MKTKHGFTLVELLVVIAIISILAATVVPRVNDYIRSSRVARAHSEIKSMDLALTKMLTDSGKAGFAQFFPPGQLAFNAENYSNPDKDLDRLSLITEFYSGVFYELLRRGKNADFTGLGNLTLVDSVKTKMGSSYMDVTKDPWGENPYLFWVGPFRSAYVIYFRCHRPWPDPEDPENPYRYTFAQKQIEDQKMRGNPAYDDAIGYPAPKDLPIYIWSRGENLVSDQMVGEGCDQSEYRNDGGDDINNWDNQQGWTMIEQ